MLRFVLMLFAEFGLADDIVSIASANPTLTFIRLMLESSRKLCVDLVLGPNFIVVSGNFCHVVS